MKKISITGIAGFIGIHLYQKLKDTYVVTGVDRLNPDAVASVDRSKRIPDCRIDSAGSFLNTESIKPDLVIHLAASTGIRNSIFEPDLYLENNVVQTFQLLEACRKNGVKYVIYASSSSVYEPGLGVMNEQSATEKQLSFYGTTKKISEIMIENYCRQFGLVAIGLRFFTVYGSWIRPDMAGFLFMESIRKGNPIRLYNQGEVFRDFTHVSDVVHAIALLVEKIQSEPSGTHQLFNIGFGTPVSILNYAQVIAKNMKLPLVYDFHNLPENELKLTHCDNSKLTAYIHFTPTVDIEAGVKEMVDWYQDYRNE
ncbi:MAG: NAD-dependent epimerase/dehydratase family protein [Crocinitomicaceae bacterium]|nr:MAG: NAD-dependent epimerase/dehydratase family protein [Crocinitomicaceae bacterium]